MKNRFLPILFVLSTFSLAAAEKSAADSAPQFTSDGKLLFPKNYREWVFLSSGVGMTYGPAASNGSGDPRFDNVFVTKRAYDVFLQSGRWPDGTMFVLEIRSSESKGSINRDGHFQGDVVGIEAEVKDEARFPNKWRFFGFNGNPPAAPAFPPSATCYSCHAKNGAVDNTFVQFYPSLRKIAQEKGTFKSDAQ